mmetsp:Transcript_9519/g.31470  ORF Transcript_9519/g.31470 Transcript_9519/m.31470 type:complete len:207 (-) Transcript_9519:67-687(-)
MGPRRPHIRRRRRARGRDVDDEPAVRFRRSRSDALLRGADAGRRAVARRRPVRCRAARGPLRVENEDRPARRSLPSRQRRRCHGRLSRRARRIRGLRPLARVVLRRAGGARFGGGAVCARALCRSAHPVPPAGRRRPLPRRRRKRRRAAAAGRRRRKHDRRRKAAAGARARGRRRLSAVVASVAARRFPEGTRRRESQPRRPRPET